MKVTIPNAWLSSVTMGAFLSSHSFRYEPSPIHHSRVTERSQVYTIIRNNLYLLIELALRETRICRRRYRKLLIEHQREHYI